MKERPVYNIEAKRSGQWWAITVAELPGVASQARRLDQINRMGRDAIATEKSVDPDSFDVTIVYDLDEATSEAVLKAMSAKGRAAAAQAEASNLQRSAARSMTVGGFTTRDVGMVLGISHQRVAQLLATAEENTFTAAMAAVMVDETRPTVLYELGRPRRRVTWPTIDVQVIPPK